MNLLTHLVHIWFALKLYFISTQIYKNKHGNLDFKNKNNRVIFWTTDKEWKDELVGSKFIVYCDLGQDFNFLSILIYNH